MPRDVLAVRAERLREAAVEVDAAAAADPVEHAVDGAAVRRAIDFVEAEPDEIAHRPAGLRDAEGGHLADVAGERVGVARVVGGSVPQEGRHVADGGEAEPGHLRVARGVDQFVDFAGLEGRPLREQADRQAAGVEAPGGGRQGQRRVVGIGAHRQRRVSGIEVGRRIGQRPAHGLAVVDHELFEARAHDGAAVRLMGDGHVEQEGARSGADGRRGGRDGIPAAPHHRVAARHGEAVADIAGLADVVLVLRRVVQRGKAQHGAAVVEVEQHLVPAPRRVGRAQHDDRRRIVDEARGIARREPDVRDRAVDRVRGIDRAGRAPDPFLVGSDGPEGLAAEGEARHAVELQAHDPRLGRQAPEQQRRQAGGHRDQPSSLADAPHAALPRSA